MMIALFSPQNATRPATGRAVATLGAILVGLCFLLEAGRLSAAQAELDFFEKRVRPLLVERCYKCHSVTGEKVKGGLLMDSREDLLKGGDTGPALMPGDPEKSLLITAVHYTNEDLKMPPKTRLPAKEVADLTAWVKAGAVWPASAGTKPGPTKETFDLKKRRQEHWAWAPVPAAVTAPAVSDTRWPASDIDRFILARLEARKLKPNAPAEKTALLRRAYFDVVGMPPKPTDVEAFLADSSPQAFAKVVDNLLASPHFGERWARHWLDSVRYGESRGHEFDHNIPNAYQYRDYVIRALNADVPYDQFLTEHVAGDLMPTPRLTADGANESVLGTGFWFLGEEVHSPVDIRQDECDRLDNRLDTMTKTFLGLTVACARCHDHKFDAISQKDYYSMMGFVLSSSYRQVRFESIEHNKRVATRLDQIRTQSQLELPAKFAAAVRPGVEKMAAQLLTARNQSNAAPADTTDLWVKELAKAKADPLHPLHAFAVLPAGADGQPVAASLETWRKSLERPVFAPEDVVVDYTQIPAKHWYQDGFSFGLRPAQTGEFRISGSAAQPLPRFISEGGAWWDDAWKILQVTGSEQDVGPIAKWERSERTLRTPEFTMKTGRLWYLVKGHGRAYSAVNSHLIIAGPLHGSLTLDLGSQDQWQWVEHNLSTYPGHRTHVEFTPAGPGEFAVAMVVQTDPKAAKTKPVADSRLATALGDGAESPEKIASSLQGVFLSLLEQLKGSQLAAEPDAEEAALSDWLAMNIDLFCAPNSPAREAFDQAIQPLAQQRDEQIAQIRANSKTAPAMLDGNGTSEFFLPRGSPKFPGEPIPRRFLEALSSGQQPDYGSGSGRLQLARQMTDPASPFTTRVAVNRVWHHLFGRGLVPTVDNFGVLGQAPSHPELLDHLAARFSRDLTWSRKKLIREIMLSQTYRMTSRPTNAQAEQLDPENLLLHRANLRRLEGEAIRDSILAVSGRLNPTAFGNSVPLHLTPFMEGRGRPGSGPLDGDGRRSIYISVRRNFLSPMMLVFDTPIPFSSISRRNVSNVPAQALTLMNDPFVVEQSKLWAKRLAPNAGLATESLLREMYLTAFGRPPSPAEIASSTAFLNQQGKAHGLEGDAALSDERVWADLAHVLINVKEFIYIN